MWTTTPSIIENERPVDRFALHYVPQTYWRVSHAFWFWAMGIGSGIFCLRQFFGISGGGFFLGMNAIDIVGLILVAIGGMILILDLGKPFRFLNSFLKPRNAWISRGAISDFIFLGLVVLYVLPGLIPSLPWSDAVFSQGDTFGRMLIVMAIFFALVIMVYPGFVLYYSRNIPLWNSIFTPILFLEYAVTGSFGLIGAMVVANGEALPPSFYGVFLASLLITLVSVFVYLFERNSPGNSCIKASIGYLLKGKASGWFWFSQIVGSLLPIIMLGMMMTKGIFPASIVILTGVCTILGSFTFRYSQLLAGLRISPLV
jgi:formate-dependent nitrite reductase membrane component NrfD